MTVYVTNKNCDESFCVTKCVGMFVAQFDIKFAIVRNSAPKHLVVRRAKQKTDSNSAIQHSVRIAPENATIRLTFRLNDAFNASEGGHSLHFFPYQTFRTKYTESTARKKWWMKMLEFLLNRGNFYFLVLFFAFFYVDLFP